MACLFPPRSFSSSSEASDGASHLDACASRRKASTRGRRPPHRGLKLTASKYPHGPPDPSDPLEVRYASLDAPKIPACALVAADDLIVRIFDIPRLRLCARSFAKGTHGSYARTNYSDFKRSFRSAFSTSVNLERTAENFTQRMQNMGVVAGDEESSLAFSNLSLRYAQLKYHSSRVTLSQVELDNTVQFRILATSDIPSGTLILELGGLMSADAVMTADRLGKGSKERKRAEEPQYNMFSVIWKDFQQCGPGSMSDRLLVGPARFINHACEPNSRLRPFPKTNAWGIESIKDILAGEEITVHYGKKYFSPGECACSSCFLRIPGNEPEPILRIPYPTPPAELVESERPMKRARSKC